MCIYIYIYIYIYINIRTRIAKAGNLGPKPRMSAPANGADGLGPRCSTFRKGGCSGDRV